MSGGTAYVYDLKPERVNRDALASGELSLLPLEQRRHRDPDGPARPSTSPRPIRRSRPGCSPTPDTSSTFVKVLPRDYAAVLKTRQTAVDEGLDPDGDVVWSRIMEVTGG